LTGQTGTLTRIGRKRELRHDRKSRNKEKNEPQTATSRPPPSAQSPSPPANREVNDKSKKTEVPAAGNGEIPHSDALNNDKSLPSGQREKRGRLPGFLEETSTQGHCGGERHARGGGGGGCLKTVFGGALMSLVVRPRKDRKIQEAQIG